MQRYRWQTKVFLFKMSWASQLLQFIYSLQEILQKNANFSSIDSGVINFDRI